MIFPEGTWNLSENEIVRDIAYGVADAAISADAVIVPIAIEQYGKFFTHIEQAARAFSALGTKAGDIVVICAVNTPEMVFAFYVLNRLGAITLVFWGNYRKMELLSYNSMRKRKVNYLISLRQFDVTRDH